MPKLQYYIPGCCLLLYLDISNFVESTVFAAKLQPETDHILAQEMLM